MNNKKRVDWAIELQSLAQAGLTYGHDVYDQERYERIREISAEIMAYQNDIPLEKVKLVSCHSLICYVLINLLRIEMNTAEKN